MGSCQGNKGVGRAKFGCCLASKHRYQPPTVDKKVSRPGETRSTPYSGHKGVTCGTLRASAQGHNADFSTAATSVEETTEPITVHLLPGRILRPRGDRCRRQCGRSANNVWYRSDTTSHSHEPLAQLYLKN